MQKAKALTSHVYTNALNTKSTVAHYKTILLQGTKAHATRQALLIRHIVLIINYIFTTRCFSLIRDHVICTLEIRT